MTTNTDHLALIKATIDTQYDLARIEIFRPLEIYDRFQKITAKDMGHDCKPTFESVKLAPDDPQRQQLDEIDELATRIARASGATPWDVTLVRHEARCTCTEIRVRHLVERYSFRVSMTWNGRTLTREYLLPEVAK